MTGKILDLISIGDRLSEETLNKKKTNNENIITPTINETIQLKKITVNLKTIL